ncbi:pyridoxal-phosphate dependent enzyme [Candidatus Spongiihabitans sp.]|uniref:pyridoxal-phosphate dependent enzyme n=1 Tax=Candidatus Spongiihabitans sp. TaxID=3101308 RepID=UPI003C6F8813
MATMVFDSVIEAIGNTPIVRLNKIAEGVNANLFAKLEFTNPGGSIKDRIGWWMIEDAEKRGALRPGGTIIEGTSGNTGVGLAIAAAIKGYKCVFILPDKMSDEKIKNLRAFGARVIVTPTAVEPDDPRSYYSVSRRMAQEIPNSLYIDQYNNLSNREYHYLNTGPEILRQMPDIDVFICGIGTGGTVTGIGKFLKENKPAVEIVAVDPIGSIVYDTFKFGAPKTLAEGYLIEGIGEDFIPGNYDFDQIDDMIQVEDKESFLMTRALLRSEGIYAGVSSGCALVGAKKWIAQQNGGQNAQQNNGQGDRLAGKNVLIIFPDSGNRYMSKVYDDDWMREVGFLESKMGIVADMMEQLGTRQAAIGQAIIMAHQADKISAVIARLSEAGVSQMPVLDENGWIKGIIRENAILKAIFNQQASVDDSIDNLVDTSVEFVAPNDSIDHVSKLVTEGKVPLITNPDDGDSLLGIITDIDLLNYLGSKDK